MENSVLGGGLLPVPGSAAGILDLDPPLHGHSQHQHQHQHQLVNPSAAAHHPQMQQMGLAGDHRPLSLLDPSDSPSARCGTQKGKGGPPSSAPNYHRHHHLHSPSDEDEDPSFNDDDNGAEEHLDGGNKSKKGSPWQRMKWTDDMVRLLIPVVACVEDESVPEGVVDGLGKRKHGAAAAGVLQKKGKWKTVSKLMLEKGCYVSPQQCEDKFNDLNKRYKRLNEILGRGTTCQVVENPALLDSMHHVSAKSKEDVRKILSSKHLFYREMCAYHNGQRIPYSHELSLQSCGAAPGVAARDTEEEEEEEEDDGEDEDDEEDGDVEERNDDFGRRGCGSFQVEMDGVLLDSTKSLWEQRDWFRKRTLQLQEERTAIQMKAFELEKRRFKWQRFCSKKDRELERMRLDNERMRLENERMALQVRQREAELEFNRVGNLMDSAGYVINREL